MFIFILFVSAKVLFEGAFPLWVSLSFLNEIFDEFVIQNKHKSLLNFFAVGYNKVLA